jgi:nucleoid-associated protein YgaU
MRWVEVLGLFRAFTISKMSRWVRVARGAGALGLLAMAPVNAAQAAQVTISSPWGGFSVVVTVPELSGVGVTDTREPEAQVPNNPTDADANVPPVRREKPSTPTATEAQVFDTQPPPGFEGVMGVIRDWLARANREFQGVVIKELSEPSTGAVAEDELAKKRAAEKAAEDARKAAADAAAKDDADRAASSAPVAQPSAPKVDTVIEDERRRRDEQERIAAQEREAKEKADRQRDAELADQRAREAQLKEEQEAKRKADEERAAQLKAEQERLAQLKAEEERAAEAKRAAEAREKAEQQARDREEAQRQAEIKRQEELRRAEALRAEEERKAEAQREEAARQAEAKIAEERRLAEEAARVKEQASAKVAAPEPPQKADVAAAPAASDVASNYEPDSAKSNSSHRQAASCKNAGRRLKKSGRYVVKSGDTLWAIAKRHYRKGSKYPKIYNANRKLIHDPDLIYPCQKIKVPRARRS